MKDPIKQLLDQRDALDSVAHLLLNELENLTGTLRESTCGYAYLEDLRDAESVIQHAHEILLALRAKA